MNDACEITTSSPSCDEDHEDGASATTADGAPTFAARNASSVRSPLPAGVSTRAVFEVPPPSADTVSSIGRVPSVTSTTRTPGAEKPVTARRVAAGAVKTSASPSAAYVCG